MIPGEARSGHLAPLVSALSFFLANSAAARAHAARAARIAAWRLSSHDERSRARKSSLVVSPLPHSDAVVCLRAYWTVIGNQKHGRSQALRK
jgi:hypothetical protein